MRVGDARPRGRVKSVAQRQCPCTHRRMAGSASFSEGRCCSVGSFFFGQALSRVPASCRMARDRRMQPTVAAARKQSNKNSRILRFPSDLPQGFRTKSIS